MTPRALFWHLIETKYSLTVNHQDLLTRHSIGCFVWKETPLSARLVDSLWLLEPLGCDGLRHSRQTCKHKSRIPCPIFGESRFPGNSQIPDPVKIFIVFPIPAPYFGQILNPENTFPNPVAALIKATSFKLHTLFKARALGSSWLQSKGDWVYFCFQYYRCCWNSPSPVTQFTLFLSLPPITNLLRASSPELLEVLRYTHFYRVFQKSVPIVNCITFFHSFEMY